jgi:hypothetical protein
VHRGTLWQVDNAGVTTNRGTLNTTTGKVSMAENGTQIVIVDGTNGYVYNMSTLAFAQIVDADFPNGAATVCWIDGYFLVEGTSGRSTSAPTTTARAGRATSRPPNRIPTASCGSSPIGGT